MPKAIRLLLPFNILYLTFLIQELKYLRKKIKELINNKGLQQFSKLKRALPQLNSPNNPAPKRKTPVKAKAVVKDAKVKKTPKKTLKKAKAKKTPAKLLKEQEKLQARSLACNSSVPLDNNNKEEEDQGFNNNVPAYLCSKRSCRYSSSFSLVNNQIAKRCQELKELKAKAKRCCCKAKFAPCQASYNAACYYKRKKAKFLELAKKMFNLLAQIVNSQCKGSAFSSLLV